MNTAYDLLTKMGSIPLQYGMYDKTKGKVLTGNDLAKINGTAEVADRCIVMHPAEVWKNKAGTCWDCTLLEYDELKRMGYKDITGVYYEVFSPKTNKVRTSHSFIIYKEKNSSGYYWFEYSWFNHRGLHGPYSSKEDIYPVVEKATLSDCPGDTISYWNKNLDIPIILEMDEISIMGFMAIAYPEEYGDQYKN